MYGMAKSAREALKSKARRLAGETDSKVDATSVKRPAAFTAEKKTGKAPVNPRAYKKGGAVKREEGGAVTNPSEVTSSMERLREARPAKPAARTLPPPSEAASRSGKAPQDVPGKKHGGRAKRADGGTTKMSPADLKAAYEKGQKRADSMPQDKVREETQKAIDRTANFGRLVEMGKKSGGRTGRKSGGGVTVINIGKGASDAPMKVPAPAPVPMPMAQPPMQPAPMPVQQPNQMPSPAARNAPLALKTGGRVSKIAKSYKDMSAGAGSGEGRLQKADVAKAKKRK